MYFSDEESTSSQEQDLIQAQRSRSPSLFDVDHDADADADADEDEDLEPMPPAPIQHGGKTLTLNAAASDSSSDDDDDEQLQMAVAEEDDNDDDDDADEDEEEVAEVQVPVPRGKVLRIPPQNDQDDTDEEDEEEAQTADVMVVDTSMDVDAEVEVEAEAEVDDMSDDAAVATATPIKGDEFGEVAVAVAVAAEEDGEAVAAIVMDGNDSDISEVAAVAEVVVPKKVRKKPGPKPKKKEKRGSTSTGGKKSSGGGKRRKRSDSDDEVHSSLVKTSGSTIARDKLEAAQKARDILLASTKTTPFRVSDSHIIHNFGRIKVESKGNPRFSTTTSLFPVGFSCDRFEFSPVHGRGLKMRCEILDGKDYAHGEADADVKTKKEGNSTKARDKLNAKSPLFRITWGQGIDELDNGKPFPFDVYSAAAPLGNNVDSVAVPMGLDVPIVPETDMRVKVRFDDDVWYRGTITRVTKKTASDVKEKKKRGTRSAKPKNKNHFSLKLLYDDGMKEEVIYPDPDIVLVAPGSEGIDDGRILNLTKVHGKHVTSVYGTTPLEAWANALIKLGLIDEIMYERALDSIAAARVEGVNEVKEKMEILKRQRQEARARHVQKMKEQSDVLGSPRSKKGDEKGGIVDGEEKSNSKAAEEATGKERRLREKADTLLKTFKNRLKESKMLSISLADARVHAAGRFLSNPFYGDQVQQKTWLLSVIKKEKSKMGSTGNKRKIVTPTDILDRNATFFNQEIERLLEGLPGSEFCADYVFHDVRGIGASQYSFVHEAKVRKEKEHIKKKKRAKEKEVKDTADREKDRKRKERDEERESRKKQKNEEMEKQKKERQDERLSKLATQVDERLFKEACFQRERVVLLASKLCGKEITRRKKVVETIAAHQVENATSYEMTQSFQLQDLPPLAKEYDLDVVRLFDFLVTYKGYFCEQFGLEELPSLDALQDAISAFSKKASSTKTDKGKASTLLNNVAVAMCKTLTSSLIKTLSSALATSLQDKNEDESPKDKAQLLLDPDNFQVSDATWKEVFRLFLLSDALSEQGLTKIEQTHVLRGYRSGGHPNSKEAKRIRRGEDSEIVLRRQGMVINADSSASINKGITVSLAVPVPCEPSVFSSDWVYYLHNIKALPSNAATAMKSNLKKALKILKSLKGEKYASFASKLESNVDLLGQIGTTYTSSADTIQVCKKVRGSVLRLLDRATGETFSSGKATEIVYREQSPCAKQERKQEFSVLPLAPKSMRARSGILRDFFITESQYKKCTVEKEEYMAAAITFKEEQERKNNAANDDDDDDDDDENEDGEQDNGTVDEEKKDTPEDANEDSTSKLKNDDEQDESIFKKTEYDDFCGDEPNAPELLRRCLAVVRNLCHSSPAETFLYPVDPQTNLRYYESVLRPISLHDVGNFLKAACRKEYSTDAEIESIVATFARKVRLIGKNVTCFSNVGGALISTAEELLRIFERLLFDWVLAPAELLPPLNMLDDERCVEYHPSDDEATVLLCDGCEGKYNTARLLPPLRSIPKGDWYCPRCRSGLCWSLLDPRIGKTITKKFGEINNGREEQATVIECLVSIPDNGQARSLDYVVRYEEGSTELWTLNEIDNALKLAGTPLEPIKCLEAVTESPGYGCGSDSRLVIDVIPVVLDPRIADSAAQRFLTSSVYRDTILSCAALLVNGIEGMDSVELKRLFNLLMMKCMASDVLQDVASTIESEAYSKNGKSTETAKIKSIVEMMPQLTEDEVEMKGDVNNAPKEGSTDTKQELSEEEKEEKRQFAVMIKTAKNRQKKREDVFLANIIKKQIKSSISSMEEDKISMVITNALVTNEFGIDYSSTRCPSLKCHFCGLSDVAVGTPLVRFPNEEEWAKRAVFFASKRSSFMIADICSKAGSDSSSPKKSAIVSVTVNGEIVGDDDAFDLEKSDDVTNCGLLPRNSIGLQRELMSRNSLGPPVITGSLSAHECCAVAAHKAMKQKQNKTGKNQLSKTIERLQGNDCGRTRSIGVDELDRSYWNFQSNPEFLFVLNKVKNDKQFLCFSTPESIASVILGLGQHRLASDLKALYPKSYALLLNGKWKELLQQKALKQNRVQKHDISDIDMADSQIDDSDSKRTFNAGDEVLVVSDSNGLLWDAHIVAVSKRDESGPITGYRIHYKGWSSRFDQWVIPGRVVDLSDENIQEQQQKASQIVQDENDLPLFLRQLTAASYLNVPRRSRGVGNTPNLRRVLMAPHFVSSEDKMILELKAALLIVEAALPNGSVKRGVWKPHTAVYWRTMVMKATTPGNLMGCLVLLENILSKEWIRSNGEHLVSCLPRPWKSINEASVSSIALRLRTLDKAIKYEKAKKDDNDWDETLDEEDVSE